MRRRIRGILMSGKQFSLDSRMDLVQGMLPIPSKKAICMPETVESLESLEENSGNNKQSIKTLDLILLKVTLMNDK